MKYGPNTEQVEAYLTQVALLEADDWASLAQGLKERTTPPSAIARAAVATGRSRARRNGVLSEVDAAAREAEVAIDAILDASFGDTARNAGDAAFREAATAAASLLVLRPLLQDGEFSRAWPMPIIDPRSLPHHIYVPPMGAAG